MHHYLWPSSPFSREVSGILGGMVKDADATEYSFCRILGGMVKLNGADTTVYKFLAAPVPRCTLAHWWFRGLNN